MIGLLYSSCRHRVYLVLPEYVGHTRLAVHKASTPHRHKIYHLVFVLEGAGKLENNYGQLDLKPGVIVLIDPREKHVFRTRESELYYFACNFHLLPLSIMEKTGGPAAVLRQDRPWREKYAETAPLEKLFGMTVDRGRVQYDPQRWPKLIGLIRALADAVHTARDARAPHHIQQFLHALLGDSLVPGRTEAAPDPLIKKIEEYLAQHARGKFSLPGLARAVDYNPSYLSGYFRKKRHETILSCFHRLKADQAAALLKTTTQPITDIAYELGYSSSQHFCLRFKECKGISPRRYRYLTEA
jgi:AraC-like DNA-binding protein